MLVQAALILGALPAHAWSDGRETQTLVASSVISLHDTTGTSSGDHGNSTQGYIPKGDIVVGGTRYTWMDESLGEGGFGTVYKLEREDKHIFAGKFIPGEETKSVKTEISLQKRCGASDNVVKVIGTERITESGGGTVIVMEYLEYGDIYSKMISGCEEQIKRCKLQGIEDIFTQVVKGVKHMHDQSVAHRDLKPTNIFLGRKAQNTSGENGEVGVIAKIGDFGLAARFDSKLPMLFSTRPIFKRKRRGLLGTRAYMSPEMIMSGYKGYFNPHHKTPENPQGTWMTTQHGRTFGDPYRGPEVDVWSLGVTLYIMLTGRAPWQVYKEGSREFADILFSDLPTEHYPNCVADQTKELINDMLTKHVRHRIVIGEVLKRLSQMKTFFVTPSSGNSTSHLEPLEAPAMKTAGLVRPSSVFELLEGSAMKEAGLVKPSSVPPTSHLDLSEGSAIKEAVLVKPSSVPSTSYLDLLEGSAIKEAVLVKPSTVTSPRSLRGAKL